MLDFDRPAVLRDGTPVRIRAARPDDEARVVTAFGKLERHSVYTRYFSFRKALSAADLARLLDNDGVRGAALLVTLGDAAQTVIGGGSYAAHPGADGRPVAEVAFTVEEDYQGQGIAGLLLDALVEVARAHGFDRIDAEVLAENAPMLRVFERCGRAPRRRRDGGVIHVEIDIAAPAGSDAG
jgi:GNAT superfamily N-acetyltransferase